MKKKCALIIMAAMMSVLASGPLLFAEEASLETHDAIVLKSLAANRSLLAPSMAEYARLKRREAIGPTQEIERKLENLTYKILALEADRSRLLSQLSEEKQAHEIMKDLLIRKASVELPAPAEEESQRPATKALEPPQKPLLPVVRGQTKISVEAMHEMALELVAQKKLIEAAKLYEEIVLTNPDDDQAYIIMGHTYLLSGSYEKAEAAFQNAAHIDPENLNEITPFYENIVLQNPEDDLAYTNLGYAYLILGEFIKAKEAFQDALSINSENGLALNGLHALEGESA